MQSTACVKGAPGAAFAAALAAQAAGGCLLLPRPKLPAHVKWILRPLVLGLVPAAVGHRPCAQNLRRQARGTTGPAPVSHLQAPDACRPPPHPPALPTSPCVRSPAHLSLKFMDCSAEGGRCPQLAGAVEPSAPSARASAAGRLPYSTLSGGLVPPWCRYDRTSSQQEPSPGSASVANEAAAHS